MSPVQSGLLPGSDAQLGLGLVMIVNVRSHLLLFLDHAGSGVAEEGPAHSRHPAQLDSSQEADWTSESEAHHGSGQRQPGHRD